jgi:hypothetical protein
MKVYWSYTQFPELAGFSNRQKKIIWLNLWEWTKDLERKSWERFLPLLIVFSLIAGITIGAFWDSNPERGGFFGGMAGIIALSTVVYLVGINTRRRVLQRYLESDDFSLIPVNRDVRVLLDPFRQHDET